MKIRSANVVEFKDKVFKVELTGEELLIIQLWTYHTAGPPDGPRGVVDDMNRELQRASGLFNTKQVCRALGVTPPFTSLRTGVLLQRSEEGWEE